MISGWLVVPMTTQSISLSLWKSKCAGEQHLFCVMLRISPDQVTLEIVSILDLTLPTAIRATGLPALAITTSSPYKTRSISRNRH